MSTKPLTATELRVFQRNRDAARPLCVFYANSTGAMLGPYDPREIGPRLFARQWLSTDGAEVYRTMARDEAEARRQFAAARKAKR